MALNRAVLKWDIQRKMPPSNRYTGRLARNQCDGDADIGFAT